MGYQFILDDLLDFFFIIYLFKGAIQEASYKLPHKDAPWSIVISFRIIIMDYFSPDWPGSISLRKEKEKP